MRLVLVTAIVIVPFTNNNDLLNAYKLLIPFLFFYWSKSDTACVKDYLERRIMGHDIEKTRFAEIVKPYYNNLDIIHVGTLVLYIFVLFETKAVRT